MKSDTTNLIIGVIKAIPYGKVASYGQIAALAGLSNGARRVARILHSSSSKYELPWHRIVKSNGEIALSTEEGINQQTSLLRAEGVIVSISHTIDLNQFGWKPAEGELAQYV